jgi:hypothetical protein
MLCNYIINTLLNYLSVFLKRVINSVTVKILKNLCYKKTDRFIKTNNFEKCVKHIPKNNDKHF